MVNLRDPVIGYLLAFKSIAFVWDHREFVMGVAIGWRPTRAFGARVLWTWLIGEPIRSAKNIGKIAVDEFVSKPYERKFGKPIRAKPAKSLTGRLAQRESAAIASRARWARVTSIGRGAAFVARSGGVALGTGLLVGTLVYGPQLTYDWAEENPDQFKMRQWHGPTGGTA